MNPNALFTLSNLRHDYGDITELLHSIASRGVEVPILYYRRDGICVIKDGHRRNLCARIINAICGLKSQGVTESILLHNALTASGLLDNAHLEVTGLNDISELVIDIPTMEVDAPADEEDLALFQLVAAKEGLRKDLNPIEEAEALNTLLKTCPAQWVANILGKSEAYVSRRHRLTELHPDFKAAVEQGKLDARAAEQLLALSPEAVDFPDLRRSLIAAKTVRRIEQKVKAVNASLLPHEQEEVPELNGDPLLLALREEARLKVAAVVKSLRELERVYREVDEKPSLTEVREAMAWIRRIGEEQ